MIGIDGTPEFIPDEERQAFAVAEPMGQIAAHTEQPTVQEVPTQGKRRKRKRTRKIDIVDYLDKYPPSNDNPIDIMRSVGPGRNIIDQPPAGHFQPGDYYTSRRSQIPSIEAPNQE